MVDAVAPTGPTSTIVSLSLILVPAMAVRGGLLTTMITRSDAGVGVPGVEPCEVYGRSAFAIDRAPSNTVAYRRYVVFITSTAASRRAQGETVS